MVRFWGETGPPREGEHSARELRASGQVKVSPNRREALDFSSWGDDEIIAAGDRVQWPAAPAAEVVMMGDERPGEGQGGGWGAIGGGE